MIAGVAMIMLAGHRLNLSREDVRRLVLRHPHVHKYLMHVDLVALTMACGHSMQRCRGLPRTLACLKSAERFLDLKSAANVRVVLAQRHRYHAQPLPAYVSDFEWTYWYLTAHPNANENSTTFKILTKAFIPIFIKVLTKKWSNFCQAVRWPALIESKNK